MPLVYSLYIGMLFGAILVNFILIVLVLKYRFNNLAKIAVIFFILIIANQLTVLFSLYSSSAAWALWWLAPARLSVQAFLIPCGFIFMEWLIHSGNVPIRRLVGWLLPLSIALTVGNLAHGWHGGLYQLAEMSNPFGVFIRTAWQGGPWLWVNLAYMQGLGLVMLINTTRWILSMKAAVRWRWMVFLVPQSLVYFLALLDPFQINLAPGLLWTPLAIGLFSTLLAIGVWYFDLLSIPLVAREMLIRYMPDIVLVLDGQNRIIDLNPTGESMLNIKINASRGAKIEDLLREEHGQLLDIILNQKNFQAEIGVAVEKDTARYFDAILTSIELESGQEAGKLIVLRDITGLKQLQKQERDFATYQERQRLARELHDAVSQTLFSARLISETLLRRRETMTSEDIASNLRQVTRLVVSALGEMRILLLELRPQSLVDTDLPSLIAHLVDAAGSRTQAKIHHQDKFSGPLPVDVKIAFYQIAQEAINNALKYSRADNITISLEPAGEGVQLIISDDGHGFGDTKPIGDHFGINIMRERAAEIGATLTITSKLKQGTQISCRWQAS